MRVRTQASLEPRAAVALARALGLGAAEARALLAVPRVLPVELTAAEVAAVAAALAPFGVIAEPLEVPPTTRRCGSHPRLTADHSCARCGTAVCPLCVDGAGAARCAACLAAERRSVTWKRRRVLGLSLVLLGAAAVGVRQLRRRARRVAWLRPVAVSVVLHSEAPLEPALVDAWRDGLAALDAWFASEAERLGAPLPRPLAYTLVEPVRAGPAPVEPPVTGDWFEDVRAAWRFRQSLEALAAPSGDVRLVVSLGTRDSAPGAIVEGLADRDGDVGLVHASGRDTELALELTAVAHETLHCLGAGDAYEPSGRSSIPAGLAEPDRVPTFPQGYAEVMAGEVPDSPDSGHVPRSLEAVRIGPVTARAIGWTR